MDQDQTKMTTARMVAIQEFMRRGRDVEFLKQWALEKGYPQRDRDGEYSLLWWAINAREPVAVRLLLEMGYSPNMPYRDSSLLIYAIDDDPTPASQDIVRLLVESGADVSSKFPGPGKNAIEYAEWRGRTDLLDILQKNDDYSSQ